MTNSERTTISFLNPSLETRSDTDLRILVQELVRRGVHIVERAGSIEVGLNGVNIDYIIVSVFVRLSRPGVSPICWAFSMPG